MEVLVLELDGRKESFEEDAAKLKGEGIDAFIHSRRDGSASLLANAKSLKDIPALLKRCEAILNRALGA